MDFSEKWGTSIDAAVDLALSDLKLTRDDVEVIVLEEPSRGFFGIGSKLAKVRVVKKQQPEPERAEPVKAKEVVKVEEKQEVHERKERREKPRQERKPQERRQRSVSVAERPSDLVPLEAHPSIDFLKEVTEKMGLSLEISAMRNDDSIYLDINGKDSGTIIGKRGQTLDAIQYLTSLVVNKENEKYIRVVVDAENYRAKREKTLENLADRLASKVVRTKRSVRLEPMNPYERKVIHATLQANPKVTTRSEGEEPYRRVIIELK
jgi:spoIIIJ-associated protein